jgi:D-aspartate ligase
MACVVGDMNLVRPLGLAGIRCAVVARQDATVRYSRFVDKVITWDGDWTDASDLADEMIRWASSQPIPPVLFYQDDEHLLFVSRHRQRLASVMRFKIAPADQLETIVDKIKFYELAVRLGVLMPQTTIVDPKAAGPDDLAFPLLLKPSTRANARWPEVEANAKALRVNSADELRQLWPRLQRFGERLVAQEIVSGSEDRIVSYHVYVADDGTIAGEFTGRKIRTLPREFGHTTALEITDAPDVADAGRKLMRALDLSGVAKIDFKRGPDGRLWLLEVNPRFNLWHHAGAVAGVNLPAMVWRDLAGLDRAPAGRARAGTEWCQVNDIRAARDWGLPFHRWVRWAIRCRVKMSLAWDDPVPVIGRAMWTVRRRQPDKAARGVDRVVVRTQ